MNKICTKSAVSRWNSSASSQDVDLLMFSRFHQWTGGINHLHHYCTATEQRLKRCQSGKRGLLHSREIKALYRAEKAILLSQLHSSSAASCHSLGAFLSMISIYRTQEVLHRLQEVSQHRVPEPSRTKSLSCHLRLHAVPTITHITASMNKRHQSGRDAERMYIRQLHSRLIDLMTGEKG